MYWDFGDRAGNLTISNFDGRNFATSQRGLTQPSLDINRFAGSLSQVGGSSQLDNLTGSAVGSFFRGPDHPAQGVGGNFNLKADAYRATGIFAGSRQP